MRRFKYFFRLAIPGIVLLVLVLYADVLSHNGDVPLTILVGSALLLGFFIPSGGWRWTALVGFGVYLVHLMGHVIDATATPMPVMTGAKAVHDLLPSIIGCYGGIFIHRLLYDGDSWERRGSADTREAALIELHEKILAQQAETKAKLEPIPARQLITTIDQPADKPTVPEPSRIESSKPAVPYGVAARNNVEDLQKEALRRFESQVGLNKTDDK